MAEPEERPHAPEELYIGPSVLAPTGEPLGDRIARRLFLPLFVVLSGVVLLFYVLFGALHVSGDSMYPSLHDGDRLLLTKSYSVPLRGDVVTFPVRNGEAGTEDLIKRVIAIPGDTVEVRDGVAFINGVRESTAGRIISPEDGTYVPPTVIATGSVFVMGDNRPVALDSRDFGPVPLSLIDHRAVFIFLPLDRFGLIERDG